MSDADVSRILLMSAASPGWFLLVLFVLSAGNKFA
jgi:hypothetical protein